jgi:hypothetical protein
VGEDLEGGGDEGHDLDPKVVGRGVRGVGGGGGVQGRGWKRGEGMEYNGKTVSMTQDR